MTASTWSNSQKPCCISLHNCAKHSTLAVGQLRLFCDRPKCWTTPTCLTRRVTLPPRRAKTHCTTRALLLPYLTRRGKAFSIYRRKEEQARCHATNACLKRRLTRIAQLP